VNTLQALLHQLEAYAQEELDLQNRLIAALDTQRDALFNGHLESMRANVELVDEQLRNTSRRLQRRQHLLTQFGAQFDVAPSTLTLSSICERLGARGERLGRLAAELRVATQTVARTTRRLSALARMHVRLNSELLESVLAQQGVDLRGHDRSGALLNAEV
jgi:hypothetical protein